MAHFNDIHPKENDETREWLRQTSSQLGPCQPPKGSTSALSKPMFTSLGFGNTNWDQRPNSDVHPSKNA